MVEMVADICYPLADAPFPLKSWQISGYAKGYLPIQEALGGPQAVRNRRKNEALTKNMVFAARTAQQTHFLISFELLIF
jgi:hypothetical protein